MIATMVWRLWCLVFGSMRSVSALHQVSWFGALVDITLFILWLGLLVAVAYGYRINDSFEAWALPSIVPIWLVVLGWKSQRWLLRDIATAAFLPSLFYLAFTYVEVTRERIPITIFS